jgi:DNA-binding GntR family transcriptional regulator
VVADYLRDAILAGRFRPGQPIRQEAVAQANGTSRVPVREALRMLESEGLVQLVQHSGARVARLDYSEFSELYRMREALEPLLLAASVPVLSDDKIAELEWLADEVELAVEDVNTWLERDRRFHLECYAPTVMPRAFRAAQDFWNGTQQYRRQFFATLSREQFEMPHVEHRLIIDAIRRGDSEDAGDRLRLHIRRTRVTLADRPDLFMSDETV